MGELFGQLLPEMVGLMITPAAVVGCLVLLGSSHPWRNAATFGGMFLLTYTVLAAIAWGIGSAADPSTKDNGTVRGWVSIVLGALFLVGGILSWVRMRRASRTASAASGAGSSGGEPAKPAWLARLSDPSLRLVATAGLLLSLLNPNIAILASGMGIVLTADVGTGAQLFGVLLLLISSILDFVVPMIGFAISGAEGRKALRAATTWLVAHNDQIGVGVLLAFGVLFVGRGLGNI
ncbi:GAP family protein [Luteipulveratus flavus]|uniref:GAP family protein n=1 Tax=Luteipulveratus flavus TaxID=3031728 RepID=A0ABT6C1F4_9MICO|nr:GAP family protein [Luteipulveratus sp. YIM 133296]MDF8262694.1 GAP family protein [Luteipulveratus sp. YIM 133296]